MKLKSCFFFFLLKYFQSKPISQADVYLHHSPKVKKNKGQETLFSSLAVQQMAKPLYCMCVCLCACESEREKETGRERERERERETIECTGQKELRISQRRLLMYSGLQLHFWQVYVEASCIFKFHSRSEGCRTEYKQLFVLFLFTDLFSYIFH